MSVSDNRKNILKDWGKTTLEIAKWMFVFWLLWPLRNASSGYVNFTRVVIGIVLFVIFAGKLFYDSVIVGIIQQRRTSVKQDLLTLIGIILVISLLVGVFLFLIGFVLVELIQMSAEEQGN